MATFGEKVVNIVSFLMTRTPQKGMALFVSMLNRMVDLRLVRRLRKVCNYCGP
jgi:hypothetical protein